MIEVADELVTTLIEGHNEEKWNLDDPIYAETPHGTYLFVIDRIEKQTVEAEHRVVLQLREVSRG